jgi:5-formyltetrahydrofolate cyclo-ligase
MNLQSKKEIRKFIIEKREAISYSIRNEWNINIFNKLINSEFYNNARVIFAFVSFKSEVDTHKIINYALADKKIICVPKIRSMEKGIEIFRINSMSELSKGYFGILEPLDNCPAVDSNDIDLANFMAETIGCLEEKDRIPTIKKTVEALIELITLPADDDVFEGLTKFEIEE